MLQTSSIDYPTNQIQITKYSIGTAYKFCHNEFLTTSTFSFGYLKKDPNRNFDILHGRVGSSNDACQDTYHGETPFSEQESKAVRDTINELVARYLLKRFVPI